MTGLHHLNRRLQVVKYVLADLLTASLAWVLFFMYRKYAYYPFVFDHPDMIYYDPNLYIGLIIVTCFWLSLYVMNGTYRRIYRKSRIKELSQTFFTSLFGVVVIFFLLILDDEVMSYTYYYYSILILFFLHFSLTALARFVISTITARKIHHRIIGFNTVIIGNNKNAVDIYQELEIQPISSGNNFIGYVNGAHQGDMLSQWLPNLGTYSEIKNIIEKHQVEEVIIAIERSEHAKIEHILSILVECGVVIKIIPKLEDYLLGTIKTGSIMGEPLLQIAPDLMPAWQQSLKRMIDIFAAIFFLLILSPLYLFLIIAIRATSHGPAFYAQIRIGLKSKPFTIYKFRSMYVDAESTGPMLSSKEDKRITPIGRLMRKIRLDELPQFYNVLIGNMSLVGPRPERKFYIDQIIPNAPHYRLLHQVKPGITSWGQVKYGYAENIAQMIERLKYEVLYIENMSLAMDFKILVYTVLIIVQGRGK